MYPGFFWFKRQSNKNALANIIPVPGVLNNGFYSSIEY